MSLLAFCSNNNEHSISKGTFFVLFVLVEMKNELMSEILLNIPLYDRSFERKI